MLQQILKDMYIDPDVLEALNEDQKKTLFLKMRQEQVRRWTEREEKVPADGRSSEALAAKPANRKSVSWLLGRDGDVAVMVIGDSDEPRTARLVGTSLEDRASLHQQKATLKSNLVNKTTAAESGRTVGEPPKPPTGIHLNLKGNAEQVSCSPPLQVSASDKPPPRAVDEPPETPQAREAATPEESKPSVTLYRPHIRVGPAAQRHVNVSSPPPASVTTPAFPAAAASTPSLRSSAAAAPAPTSSGSLASAPAPSLPLPVSSAPALALARCSAPALALARASSPASTSASASTPTPTPALTPPLALSPSAPTSSNTASKTPTPTPPPPSSRLHLQEPPEPPPQESQANRDIRVVAASRRLPPEEEAGPEGIGGGVRGGSRRGRVAQLMKTFSAAPPALAPPPRGSKPPLPSKPSHLRLAASPSLR